jgi:hypothetical protein
MFRKPVLFVNLQERFRLYKTVPFVGEFTAELKPELTSLFSDFKQFELV